jgi:hypothetical protein
MNKNDYRAVVGISKLFIYIYFFSLFNIIIITYLASKIFLLLNLDFGTTHSVCFDNFCYNFTFSNL